MTPQLDLFASRTERDLALGRVAANSPDFITRALEVIAGLEHGRKVTGEDIRFRCEMRDIRPHHPNAHGALINTAVRRHLLTPTKEYTQMKDRSSHARATRVYLAGAP